MPKSRASRGILLTSNLPQLQNLIKRDPEGYKEEFLTQYNHYLSLLRLQQVSSISSTNASNSSNVDKSNELFGDLITFISQVAQCYPAETRELPLQFKGLLLGSAEGGQTVKGDLRRTVVKNLVMLRNKEIIDSIELLQILLPLLPQVPSALRGMIRHTILTDIKTSNQKTKNHRLNRVVQSLLFGMVESGMTAQVVGDKGKGKVKEKGGEAMWAVMMVKELWKKGVWNDAKTVSIVALAAFHPNTKVQSAALHFFLGSDNEDENETDSDEEDIREARRGVKKMEHRMEVGKSGRKKDRMLAQMKRETNKKRAKHAAGLNATPNFPALELLHDPQTFGEKLYDNLHKHDKIYSLDHKILIMQLLSRVMGVHKLCVLGFYSYIIKYLTYHQLQVTLILVSLAQSVHELTPPDVLTPVIRKLAQEFVHPGVGAEVIAAGLNAIREVCRRQPWCMEEDLLSDLIDYRKSKDKGVVTASRGLLQLFREVNPGMLKRRERGKAASMGLIGNQVLAYGHSKDAAEGIEGLELLEEHFASLRKEADGDIAMGEEENEDEDGKGWEDWDVESDNESESSGWEDVSSGEEELDISDSDDEEDRKRDREEKRKLRKLKQKSRRANKDEEQSDNTKKLSLLAQQKILTPADFALLNELRLKAAKELAESGGGSGAKRKLAALEASKRHVDGDESERFLTENEILGPRKKAKATWEEKMELVQKGREGREKFGSLKGKKQKGTPSSSTNREKARNKPLMMAVHSNKVMQKKKASLRDKQIKLRAAIDKQKKLKH
uniref:Protein SDA1 n=1 Tax=Kwoniella dejecticola CBS 10117 TaxID=1296121 RepID=A0A1A5ZZ11_9TREE|nr:protein SDA1 [Kwoniella dejecticola CBS 10117]OBR83044.1 protein SDA1 [Kwoniella dejecticola CBS 10117]